MPTKRYRRTRKQLEARRRKLRKEWDDTDKNLMAVSTGSPPKESGK